MDSAAHGSPRGGPGARARDGKGHTLHVRRGISDVNPRNYCTNTRICFARTRRDARLRGAPRRRLAPRLTLRLHTRVPMGAFPTLFVACVWLCVCLLLRLLVDFAVRAFPRMVILFGQKSQNGPPNQGRRTHQGRPWCPDPTTLVREIKTKHTLIRRPWCFRRPWCPNPTDLHYRYVIDVLSGAAFRKRTISAESQRAGGSLACGVVLCSFSWVFAVPLYFFGGGAERSE